MGFREALDRVFGPHQDEKAQGAAYDRAHWRKKLARVLEQLPDSQGEWESILTEARALGFDASWVQSCQREEFALMIRRAVADGVLTGMEHRKLDLARDLIGIPDAEAETTLNAIVSEAESFFGKSVEGA